MSIFRHATAAIVLAAGCLTLSSCNENNPYAAAAYGSPGAPPVGKNWDKNGDGRIQSHDNRDWGYRTNANFLDQYTY